MKLFIEDKIGISKEFEPKIIPSIGDKIVFNDRVGVVKCRNIFYDKVGNIIKVVVEITRIKQ
jgi:hypothetical protein